VNTFSAIFCVVLVAIETHSLGADSCRSLTNFNVVIAVFSMFVLLIKVVLNVMKIFHPLLSIAIHVILCIIWAVSVYGQAGPDKSDPEHPSSVAWYVSKSCSVTFNKGIVHYCELAKGTFAVTCVML